MEIAFADAHRARGRLPASEIRDSASSSSVCAVTGLSRTEASSPEQGAAMSLAGLGRMVSTRPIGQLGLYQQARHAEAALKVRLCRDSPRTWRQHGEALQGRAALNTRKTSP